MKKVRQPVVDDDPPIAGLLGGRSNVVEPVISRLRRTLDGDHGDHGDTEGTDRAGPRPMPTVQSVGHVVRQVTE
ncbi:hypothetical protein ACFW9L_22515 [Streptomyces sp. NPDC059517]|uniref:hypothetical protein n=1 Tax=Streptomyces sp. NPDC059517 TaxID=3346855 RepID=UPI0036D15FDC